MLLIARAPVRISFGGGGTDIPAYYERYGGFVVSTTISYYVYTILTPGPAGEVEIFSADYRSFTHRPVCEDLIWDGDLSLPKAIVYYFNIRDGLTVFLASQVPPGTGLGSSGSVAVSMIKALAFWCGLDLGPREVAELACFIEINKLGMPVGKQDQYAAAFGGLNGITFLRNEVRVEPLQMPPPARQELEQGIMLFFTGVSRQSSTILKRQQAASQEGDPETIRRLTAIRELGLEMRRVLENGDLKTFGELLHRSWMEKRRVAEGITTPLLDRCYEVARERGALGGKVTGAGGGGFLMLYCPPQYQSEVTEALTALGLQRRPFLFENEGVQIMQGIPWTRTSPRYPFMAVSQPVGTGSATL